MIHARAAGGTWGTGEGGGEGIGRGETEREEGKRIGEEEGKEKGRGEEFLWWIESESMKRG